MHYHYCHQSSCSPGIHGPPGPRTRRSSSVRHFKNFLGPCPVRSAGLENLLVRVRSGPRISKFSWSASGPVRGPLLFSGWSGPFFLESYLDKFHVRRSKIQHYRNRSPSQMKMVQVIGTIIRNAYLKLERVVGKTRKVIKFEMNLEK